MDECPLTTWSSSEIESRLDSAGCFHEPYIRLVRELSRRGWVQSALVEHTMRRASK